MRKLLPLLLMLLVSAFLFASGAPEEEMESESASPYEGMELVVSTWGFNMDLIEENLTKPFEEMYGVDVIYETGNNADRFTKLAARKDNPNVDVVHFAGNWAHRASEEGLLQPYDPLKMDNLGALYTWAGDPLGNQHAVGYAVISYGLAYRTDQAESEFTSWNDLSNPEFDGYVSIPDITTTFGPATVVMMAAANGGGINNVEPGWEALEELSDNLVTIYRRSSELVSLIQQEEVWAAPYTSFSWGSIDAIGLPIEPIIPEEGLVGSMSMAGIVNGTDKVDLAHEYLNWILAVDVQESQALDLVDSPTNMDVRVPDEVAGQLTYGDEIINSLVFLDEAELAERQEAWVERWNEIFSQ